MGLQKISFNFMVKHGEKFAKSLLCSKPQKTILNTSGLKYAPNINSENLSISSFISKEPSIEKLEFFQYLEMIKKDINSTLSTQISPRRLKNGALPVLSGENNISKYGIKSYKDLIKSNLFTQDELNVIKGLYSNAKKHGLEEMYDKNLSLLINFANTAYLNKIHTGNFVSLYDNLSREQLKNIKYIANQIKNGSITPNEVYAIRSRVCTEIPHEFYNKLATHSKELFKQIKSGQDLSINGKYIGSSEECKQWLDQIYYLKNYLNKQSLPEEMVVHRIDSYSPLNNLKIGDKRIVDLMQDKNQIKNIEKFFDERNNEVIFNNFVGTSLADLTNSTLGKSSILWNIKLPKGSKAAFLPATLPAELARFDEMEVLLQAGTKFNINSAKFKNNMWDIDVTAIM